MGAKSLVCYMYFKKLKGCEELYLLATMEALRYE